MTQQRVLELLRRHHNWLDRHFDEIYESLSAKEARVALRAAYVSSRDNLRVARSRIFIDHDPGMGVVFERLQSMTTRLEASAGLEPEQLSDLIERVVAEGSRLVNWGIPAG